jgi:DNA-directed RNA polymerase specialized sigma24 family protein
MNGSPLVDETQLSSLGPHVHSELRRLALTDSLPPEAALRQIFRDLFGPARTREEELRFIRFAAPMARRIAISLAKPDARLANTDITTVDLREWLQWLDAIDPLCARMIDLHYFGGATTRETARLLQLAPGSVVRDLRFAKSWLQAKLA